MKSGDEWKLAVVMETKQGVSTGKVRGVWKTLLPFFR